MIELFTLPGKALAWAIAGGFFLVMTICLTFLLFALCIALFGPLFGFIVALIVFINFEFRR